MFLKETAAYLKLRVFKGYPGREQAAGTFISFAAVIIVALKCNVQAEDTADTQ